MSAPVNQIAPYKVDGAQAGTGILTRLGRVLWPPRCLCCEAKGDEGRDLCRDCRAALPWNQSACIRCALPLPTSGDSGAPATALVCGGCQRRPPALVETHAAFLYARPLDRLLPRLKFHHDLTAGRLLSQLMADRLASAPRPDALVPIPLHDHRLRQRGYDQALELARPLARMLALPLLEHVLRRHRHTAPQSRLDAAQRRRNLRDAFAVQDRRPLPARVVLVDDVMTTGATLHAAARALRRAGVERVDAWVCARVP